MQARLPDNTERTVLTGRTGTGKTVAGLWHLSNYDFEDRKPWVVVDFKLDEHINSIDNAKHVPVGYVPRERDTGLFIVHPLPEDTIAKRGERSRLDDYFYKLWDRENVGIFLDELFMVGPSGGLDYCFTQGRSKRIPIIACTQRPVWVTRFAFSEAGFIQVFHLNDDRDRQTVESFTPLDVEDFDRLGRHESFYYDVAENHLTGFKPVPSPKEILKVFDQKLRHRVALI